MGAAVRHCRPPARGREVALNASRLPESFRFLVIRRISGKLAWVWVKCSGSGLHTFLSRGEDIFPTRRPLERLQVHGGATYESPETTRRAA
jgi:hypothetical protein